MGAPPPFFRARGPVFFKNWRAWRFNRVAVYWRFHKIPKKWRFNAVFRKKCLGVPPLSPPPPIVVKPPSTPAKLSPESIAAGLREPEDPRGPERQKTDPHSGSASSVSFFPRTLTAPLKVSSRRRKLISTAVASPSLVKTRETL